jgi:hypothetical protein
MTLQAGRDRHRRERAVAALRGRIEAVCWDAGFEPPAICAPEKLPGGEDDERG